MGFRPRRGIAFGPPNIDRVSQGLDIRTLPDPNPPNDIVRFGLDKTGIDLRGMSQEITPNSGVSIEGHLNQFSAGSQQTIVQNENTNHSALKNGAMGIDADGPDAGGDATVDVGSGVGTAAGSHDGLGSVLRTRYVPDPTHTGAGRLQVRNSEAGGQAPDGRLLLEIDPNGNFSFFGVLGGAIFKINQDGALQGKTGKALTFNL